MVWKNPWYNSAMPHHRPDGFCNPAPQTREDGDVQRWRKNRRQQRLPYPPKEGYAAFQDSWWQPVDFNAQGDGVWWLGHASLLLRLSGQYLLTDPVFSRRASPLTFYGPERKTPSPITLSELPHLDAVLISHNHYDHLDKHTIMEISRRFPEAYYYVPLGLKPWFLRLGIKQVVELDWWESKLHSSLSICAVPARHWSMRTLWDRNRTLWCGWVIGHAGKRFWFSGDTGYSKQLLEIPERLGVRDAAAIPIGAYAPRWFMGDNHMAPEQAVLLWQKIGKPLAIPIHWGVFELGDESLDEPPQVLLDTLIAAGESLTRFAPVRIGAFISMP